MCLKKVIKIYKNVDTLKISEVKTNKKIHSRIADGFNISYEVLMRELCLI